jgi:hypothetical protein
MYSVTNAGIYCDLIPHAFNSHTMKLKIWIGPLIAVIILATLRQMMYNSMQDEQQQSDIRAAINETHPPAGGLPKAMPEHFNPLMTGTRVLTDTLPF